MDKSDKIVLTENLENESQNKLNLQKTEEVDVEFSKAYGFEHLPNECCQDCY